MVFIAVHISFGWRLSCCGSETYDRRGSTFALDVRKFDVTDKQGRLREPSQCSADHQ